MQKSKQNPILRLFDDDTKYNYSVLGNQLRSSELPTMQKLKLALLDSYYNVDYLP